jgi:hypothetical protein
MDDPKNNGTERNGSGQTDAATRMPGGASVNRRDLFRLSAGAGAAFGLSGLLDFPRSRPPRRS